MRTEPIDPKMFDEFKKRLTPFLILLNNPDKLLRKFGFATFPAFSSRKAKKYFYNPELEVLLYRGGHMRIQFETSQKKVSYDKKHKILILPFPISPHDFYMTVRPIFELIVSTHKGKKRDVGPHVKKLFLADPISAKDKGDYSEEKAIRFLHHMVGEGILDASRRATFDEDRKEKTDCWFTLSGEDIRLQIKFGKTNWYLQKCGEFNIYFIKLNQDTTYPVFREMVLKVIVDTGILQKANLLLA